MFDINYHSSVIHLALIFSSATTWIILFLSTNLNLLSFLDLSHNNGFLVWEYKHCLQYDIVHFTLPLYELLMILLKSFYPQDLAAVSMKFLRYQVQSQTGTKEQFFLVLTKYFHWVLADQNMMETCNKKKMFNKAVLTFIFTYFGNDFGKQEELTCSMGETSEAWANNS